MKHLAMALLLVALLSNVSRAQTPSGEALFAQTCGTGYCHATKGVGGGAPRLAARGLTIEFIRDRVSNGVPGTAMTAYKDSMNARDLAAVVAYVASLNGGASNGAISARRTFSGAAEQGRTLFSEATRGFGRCSTCHQANGIGIPVAPPLSQVPASVTDFKNLSTPKVVTARVAGESMPALLVARRSQEIIFYDLTSSPPVLRTLAPGTVETTETSSWRHASALGSYSDNELTAILTFLRGL
jgi:mono/diheme cytochrome c family protein